MRMSSQSDLIEKVETGLNEVLNIIPSSGYEKLREELLKAQAKLHMPMQLAVMGKISSSKSTLVNAILGKENAVSTGQMEVTFNVSWLKYGENSSEFIVHYKDGTTDTINFSQWEEWTTRKEGRNELKQQVSYIETHYDSEILKEINIIDTPGLDAQKQIDSQNTIDFLHKVRPDAIIMMFTKGISDNILEYVQQFCEGGSFTPMNAIGVFAKIDTTWDTNKKEIKVLPIGKRISKGYFERDSSLHDTLYDIYPISSLMFLNSRIINKNDWSMIKVLSETENTILDAMFDSADDFLDDEYASPVSIEDRKKLLAQYDRYTLYLLTSLIKEKPHATVEDAKKILDTESGADRFMTVLQNHFGGRAQLIKVQSISQRLFALCNSLRSQFTSSVADQHTLAHIEQKISNTFSSLIHEHKEYEILNKIYSKSIDITPEEALEFCHITGEKGLSAPERLGIKENCSPKNMLLYAKKRELHWTGELNLETDPQIKEWMRVMRDSYTRLYLKIKELDYYYKQAEAFLFNK